MFSAAALLEPLVAPVKSVTDVTLRLLAKPKSEDGSAQIADLISVLSSSADSPIVGAPLKVGTKHALEMFCYTARGTLHA